MARIEIDPNYSGPTFSRATAATDLFKKEDVQNLAAAISTHTHDGAGKGLTVAAAAAGSITTAMLAAHAVSQIGFASGVADASTSAGAYVDLPDLTVTLTTTGGDVIALLVADVYHSSPGSYVSAALARDGAAEVGAVFTTAAGNGYEALLVSHWAWPALAAGSHNFKGRWSAQGATGTSRGAGGRQLLVVEFKR